MGHDEDKNNFDTGGVSSAPITPNPRATITSGNRLGMRASRNISAAQAELDRISADSNPNATQMPSSVAEDIKLAPPEVKGKNGKKIALLVGLAVVAIIVFVASLFISKNVAKGGNDKAKKEYITSYLKLIQYGDSEIAADLSLDMGYNFSYIYSLVEDSPTSEEKTRFAHALNDMSGKLGDSLTKNQSLSKMVKTYVSYLSLDEEMNALEKAFIEEGEEAARNKYSAQSEEASSEKESVAVADQLVEGIVDYKDAYIGKMKIYAANGCIKDNAIVVACRDFVDQNAKAFGIHAINRDYVAAWTRIEKLFEEGSKYLYEESIAYYREGL